LPDQTAYPIHIAPYAIQNLPQRVVHRRCNLTSERSQL
jgi:hypothetical protein